MTDSPAFTPLRSVLYMPSSNAKALEKAKTLPIDGVIFDLEDAVAPDAKPDRSEEHTSELQSLMRISYAVFCLKKKNTNQHISNHPTHTHPYQPPTYS